jgi:hypothetical protein
MLHYLVRALGWPLGLRFVTYNYIKPISRWGRFKRWGSGYFWIIPLVEQTHSPIDIGVRKAQLNFNKVMSQDNIPFEFRLTVLFAFNPDLKRQIPSKELADRFVIFSEQQQLDPVFKSMINDYISERLRSYIATIKAEEVCHESTRFRIKHDLIHHLEVRLHDLGLILIGDGILIHEIMVPEKFQRMMLDAEQHEVILRSLSEYKDQPELIDKAVQAEFLDSLEEHKGEVRIGPRLDLDYLYYPREQLRKSE